MSWRFVVLAGALPLLAGCGGDDETAATTGGPTPVACPEDHMVAGACAGVPAAAVCEAATCTEGASCASVIEVHDQAGLDAALASATAGSCIALGEGSYGAIALPGGVSLLGKSADLVKVEGVVVGVGDGALVRGVGIGAQGMRIDGTGAKVDAVRISNAASHGVVVSASASAAIHASEILHSTEAGVVSVNAGTVTIELTLVEASGAPGIWAECTSGCSCAATSSVALTNTRVRDSKRIGVSLAGVKGTLVGVDIEGNTPDPEFAKGGGLVIWSCADVTASAVRVRDNSFFGVLVDDAGAALGNDSGTFEVSGNSLGVWVQNAGQTPERSVKIDRATITKNKGVGLGVSGDSRGIICWNSAITGTELATIPVEDGGVAGMGEAGDGIVWSEGSALDLDQLTLDGNGRASILIDGEVGAGSSIAHLTLTGGDQDKGVLQQSTPNGGASPTVGEGAPVIEVSATEVMSVPVGPATPAGL